MLNVFFIPNTIFILLRSFIFYVLLSLSAVAQNNTAIEEQQNSLAETKSYTELETSFWNIQRSGDLEEAKIYANALLAKAKKENTVAKIADAYFMFAYTSQEKEVLKYADSIVLVTKNNINFLQPARAHIMKANYYGTKGLYKKAFIELDKANICANQSGNTAQFYYIKYLIARLKTDVGDYQSSIDILNDVLSYYENTETYNIRGSILALWAYGANLNFLKKPDFAQNFTKKAISLSLQTPDSLVYNRLLLSSIISHYEKQDFSSSRDSMIKLKQLSHKKVFSINTNILMHLYEGKLYLHQQEDELATQSFEKVDSISFSKKYFHPLIRENYELLIDHYKEKKDIDKQLHYIDKLLISDSILDKNFAYLARSIQKEYTAPNLILEKQKIITSLKKTDTTKKIVIIALVLLISLLIAFLIQVNRKKKAYRKRINELGTKKKDPGYTIDDETTKRLLTELSKIEDSDLFIDQDFSLGTLAKLLNTNTSYLSKTINKYKHKSFKQYLIELRINFLIKKLDENSVMQKYSIEALAESIGYKNASSFTRIFKSYIGESPSSFLNKRYPERNK